jgi:hypothetical protein
MQCVDKVRGYNDGYIIALSAHLVSSVWAIDYVHHLVLVTLVSIIGMKCQYVHSPRLILQINAAHIVNGTVFRSACGIPCRADCLVLQVQGLTADAVVQGGFFLNKRTPLHTAPTSPPICTVPQQCRGCLQLRRAHRGASSTVTYTLGSRTLRVGDPRLAVTRARPMLIIH